MNFKYISYAFLFLLVLGSVSFASPYATGGTEYTVLINGTNYTVHVFTSNGYFNTTQKITNASILVVGGGGAGGNRMGGGGGAGGLIFNGSHNISIGIYSITVGAGGTRPAGAGATTVGTNGGWSYFDGMNATGGGRAGSEDTPAGASGGSGGGGAYYNGVGGSGVSGQGYSGGNGTDAHPSYRIAGGGGGANQTGRGSGTTTRGNGGNGSAYDINGSVVYYAGGGGSGGSNSYGSTYGRGLGGLGGGGDGADSGEPQAGTNGLGGGGGGSSFDGARGNAGGSGVVIIRYEVTAPDPTNISYPAISLNSTAFCDNFGDGGTCDHGYSANWVQIATMEADESWSVGAADTTNYKEGARGIAWLVTAGNFLASIYNIPDMDLSSYSNITMLVFNRASSNLSKVGILLDSTGAATTNYYNVYQYTSSSCAPNSWCYINVPKTSFTLTGSPTWSLITRVILYEFANETGGSNTTFDNLRAVGSTGQFNDTANNVVRWNATTQEWEIQLKDGNKKLINPNGTATGSPSFITLNMQMPANATIYATMDINDSRSYNAIVIGNMRINTYSVSASATSVRRAYFYPGTPTNTTDIGYGDSIVDFKIITNTTDIYVWFKNNSMGTWSFIGNRTYTPDGTLKLYSGDGTDPNARGAFWDNILIQSHMPNATNTTDNNGIFTRGQALEASALVEGSGEVVGDWYQDGTLNKTAPRAVAYYPFDAPLSNATYTPDLSIAGGNDANVSGATWQSNGIKGGAYSFDGTNDYINSSAGNLSNGSSFAFALWAKRNQMTYGGILSSYNNTHGYMLYQANGPTRCYVGSYSATSSLAENEMAHFVCSFNGTNLSIYKNGAHVQTVAATFTNQEEFPLKIGMTRAGGYDLFFNGTIDEVYIYNQSLTADEISQLYRKGMIGSELNALGLTYSTGAVWYANFSSYQVFNITQNVTLENIGPAFTNVSFTANGSSYQLGPVQLNFSATDLDTSNITWFVNWFLNGTNITAYAQTGTMANGSTVSVSPNASSFNVSDNWYARVWVTDGTSTTPYNNTHNTTIQNYFSNVSAYAPQGYSHLYTPSYINFTLAGAANASAYFVINNSNVTMANTGTGSNYEFRNLTIIPPIVTTATNYTGTWYYRAILANGSYYELNTTQTVNINISGFFACNATLNTTATNYSMFDAFTLLPVNASVSLLIEWTGDDGVAVAKNLVESGNTTRFCITPSTFNRQAIISESITATDYLPAVTFRELQNYSSNVTERIIYLTNSSSGSVYTFQTLSQFSSPIPGATVTVMQGSTTTFTGTTDETGSVLVPLTQLSIYQVAASATGYTNTSFNFVAGATTTIPITLLSTSAQNVTAPNYQAVFDEVQFTITPALRFFTSPQNITYTTSSPNGSLESWGWIITSNSTVINTQTSTTATGGSIVYLVNQTGTYFVNIWFKAAGFANYTPPAYVFTYGNNSGVYSAGQTLQTGSVISGFGYYLLAVVLAMMGALWVSQYSPEGAAIVGLLILCAFTFMWSDAVVVELGVDSEGQPNGITALMATGFVLLLTMSAFYLRQYGA